MEDVARQLCGNDRRLALDNQGPHITGAAAAADIDDLTVSVLDEVVGTAAVGAIFEFDTPVNRFQLTGLDSNQFLLDDNLGFIDEALKVVFGATVDEAGTVIRVAASAPLAAGVSKPGTPP